MLQVKDPALSQFLRDVNSFVASSREAIERSPPHIYLSALPFANKNSLFYQDLAPGYTGSIAVEIFGIGQHGGSTLMTLAGKRILCFLPPPCGRFRTQSRYSDSTILSHLHKARPENLRTI